MTDGTFSLVDARGRKYLTRAERERFLAAARAHPKPGVQTLARTLAITGCRVSEALGIRACDVDLEARELRIATLKRRKAHWRAVPVPEDLVHVLELVHRLRRLQASARGANRRLWPITRQTANRQVGAIMRTAGIEGPQACPRGLRHSYGVARGDGRRPAPDHRGGPRARVAHDDRDLRDGDRRRGPRARESRPGVGSKRGTGGWRWPHPQAKHSSGAGRPTRTSSTRRRTRSPRSSTGRCTPIRGRRRRMERRVPTSGFELGPPFGRGRGGPGGWRIHFDPELHPGDDILVPELAGWRRERMPELPDTPYFTLAPDWACEVLSPSTRRLDLQEKRPVYAREGVAYLWLVDPADRTLEAFELREGQWVLIACAKDDDPVSVRPFDAITFSLGDLWA